MWQTAPVFACALMRTPFRRTGGPYLLEGGQHFYATLVASDWKEVEEVIDGTFLKSAGIATPWSKRQEQLVAMGLPK